MPLLLVALMAAPVKCAQATHTNSQRTTSSVVLHALATPLVAEVPALGFVASATVLYEVVLSAAGTVRCALVPPTKQLKITVLV